MKKEKFDYEKIKKEYEKAGFSVAKLAENLGISYKKAYYLLNYKSLLIEDESTYEKIKKLLNKGIGSIKELADKIGVSETVIRWHFKKYPNLKEKFLKNKEREKAKKK
ncbi:MAG: hypothetical protein N2323_01185 [candidate division WOR-3 bacterium]|nr:hypothetical protein [candidate division WOR-3 bacterium]MCX7836560.1 hypothetical protein [candidate division WOR-3 bacterium]MDW8113905.1 hypothetical protein [candidate division WOR-3 bacterium]